MKFQNFQTKKQNCIEKVLTSLFADTQTGASSHSDTSYASHRDDESSNTTKELSHEEEDEGM